MSFLDNLENNLKNLENSQENHADEKQRREREAQSRAAREAARPWADALRDGPFTQELLTAAVRIGHSKRVAVRPVWLGDVLRLEARDRKLELHPNAHGIEAIAREGDNEEWRDIVELEKESAARLAERWLNPSGTP